ncbi:MAG: class I SAM-dependent methyltransferase [Verrucomicrobiae bacterium]|nr:class I SAM-dependent methyltransferase [Verrucomicrobiae bacterium]
MENFEQEVAAGARFQFGKNWKSFLSTLTEERIHVAGESLRSMLEAGDLRGKTFLDVGCGSGLFSLAARRMGAKVLSFDYDPDSVGCAMELKRRYFPDDTDWTIRQGSVLDKAFLNSLGTFDVVYAWGVLHHTGQLWQATENVTLPVNANGLLFVAIYNDMGLKSKVWRGIKRAYCSGWIGKMAVAGIFIPYCFARAVASSLKHGENLFAQYKKRRGMSIVHDWFDWLGGYPYEVARAEEMIRFYGDRGFGVRKQILRNDSGNNEIVFQRNS